jgi:hypothetical protein
MSSRQAALLELGAASAMTWVVATRERFSSHGERGGVFELEHVGHVLRLVGLDANDDVPSALGAEFVKLESSFFGLGPNYGGTSFGS